MKRPVTTNSEIFFNVCLFVAIVVIRRNSLDVRGAMNGCLLGRRPRL